MRIVAYRSGMLLAHDLTGPVDAPEVVLIHGITENRHSWDPLLAGLARRHRVLRVDLRGHGESPDADAFDPISYATDVVETAASVGFTRPLVVGHSLGGIVASAYAAIAPCRGVINVDQPLRLSAFKESLAQLEPLLRGTDAEFQQAISLMFDAMAGPLPAKEQARLGALRRAERHVVMGTWNAVFESTADELDATVGALASAITVPYLALHGLGSDEDYFDYVEWLRPLLSQAKVVLWPDTGHYPHLVDPDRFIDRLYDFEETLVR